MNWKPINPLQTPWSVPLATEELRVKSHVVSARSIDELLTPDLALSNPGDNRVWFGKVSFRNRTVFNTFSFQQRALYKYVLNPGKDRSRFPLVDENISSKGREYQLDMLEYLKYNGGFPPPILPMSDATLDELLAPTEEKRAARDGREYIRLGNLLVQENIFDDFTLTYRYVAELNERCGTLVPSLLACLRQGMPWGCEPKDIFVKDVTDTTSRFLADKHVAEILWNRKQTYVDVNCAAKVSPAIALMHEGAHCAALITDWVGHEVRSRTPNEAFGDHEELRVYNGLERELLRGCGLPPRTSNQSYVMKAKDVLSFQAAFFVSIDGGEYTQSTPHQTVGTVIELDESNVTIRTQQHLVAYHLEELRDGPMYNTFGVVASVGCVRDIFDHARANEFEVCITVDQSGRSKYACPDQAIECVSSRVVPEEPTQCEVVISDTQEPPRHSRKTDPAQRRRPSH